MGDDFTPVIRKNPDKAFQKIRQKTSLRRAPSCSTSISRQSPHTRIKSKKQFRKPICYIRLGGRLHQARISQKGDYSKYEGAQFSKLFKRQRELPFGRKLQNHALNHRMNEEFRKFFPQIDAQPIL